MYVAILEHNIQRLIFPIFGSPDNMWKMKITRGGASESCGCIGLADDYFSAIFACPYENHVV